MGSNHSGATKTRRSKANFFGPTIQGMRAMALLKSDRALRQVARIALAVSDPVSGGERRRLKPR
jgi:hypothetical protein